MNRTSMTCLISVGLLLVANRANASNLNPIGIHIAADQGSEGSSTGEQPELLGPDVSAGVVPISNWNDFVVTRFLDGRDNSSTNPPAPQSIPTSATPFTLNDSSGAATTAQVTAWDSNDSFDVYAGSETSANPNAQLVNGFLGSIDSVRYPNHPANFTVGGVPYTSGYDVYVYFNGATMGQEGSVGIGSGSFLSPTVYFLTMGQESPATGPFFLDATSNDPSSYTQGNYAEFALPAPGSDGTNNAFTVTIQTPYYAGDTHAPIPGIAAIELVPIAAVPEPSSLVLIFLGTITACILFVRRSNPVDLRAKRGLKTGA